MEQKLIGGKADKKEPFDFDLAQIKKGLKVEMEHTNDKLVALEIVMDHLEESPRVLQLSGKDGERYEIKKGCKRSE